ncbi:hypothetical protein ASPBRDRAFT_655616 [Aspergillus brasiliensis CBS 101740]|uniref:Uncharacterized protein n=1 Tax=Aspergillus brasiliensis (strain CBS 101740 / IMI 381727 / IBT 21946) TaxID=767769 RepID=A0A1L9V1C0_ASPBC|nr:hypothetical protein ASPBRDRAFT_655616 [Aspergillus brasiliensis CBS 101740]
MSANNVLYTTEHRDPANAKTTYWVEQLRNTFKKEDHFSIEVRYRSYAFASIYPTDIILVSRDVFGVFLVFIASEGPQTQWDLLCKVKWLSDLWSQMPQWVTGTINYWGIILHGEQVKISSRPMHGVYANPDNHLSYYWDSGIAADFLRLIKSEHPPELIDVRQLERIPPSRQ